MSATLLTDQQKEDINSEVARLRNYLQLLQYCRNREKHGQAFSPDTTKVIVEFLTCGIQNIFSRLSRTCELF